MEISMKSTYMKGGSNDHWLLETTQVQEVVGSNPGAIYWMDIFRIDFL